MSEDTEESRQARVNHAGDGKPLGVALFITARELRSLGIDPEDADRVVYSVEEGELRFSELDRQVLAE